MALDPTCRVCGTELAGTSTVSCELCQTPHHRDCWEYWGRCATYACTGLERGSLPAAPEEPATLEVRAEGRTRYLPRRPLVSSHRALLWSVDGAHVRLDSEETALQLPPDMALELPMPLYAGARELLVSTFLWVVLTAVGVLRSRFHAPDAVALLLTYLPSIAWFLQIARFGARRRARRANRVWLVKGDEGLLTLETQEVGRADWLGGRLRHALVVPGTGGRGLRATGLVLRPAHGDGEQRAVVKAYRLQLGCELPGGGLDLIVPLAVPGKGEPRRQFLEELAKVRALGRQIAELFRVPYVELGQERPIAPQIANS